VYTDSVAEVVGPVRSARHYFVQLATEFHAPIVHIGASPQGYDAIRELNVLDLDETYGHPGFWRSPARWAPHNAYVSTASAHEGLATRGEILPGQLAGFHRRADPEARVPGPLVDQLEIDYHPWSYRVAYTYDPPWNRYLRDMEGQPHVDAETGEQLAAGSVIVQFAPTEGIPGDDKGRLDIHLIGEGRAAFFLDGTLVEGIWRRESLDLPTEWWADDGRPILFPPGPIWVQIVPLEATLAYGGEQPSSARWYGPSPP